MSVKKVLLIAKAATLLKRAVVFAIAVIAFGLTQGATQPPNVSIADLGTLPGDDSSAAMGINERGQIVGWSEGSVPGEYHPVLWQNGAIVALMGSGFAMDINGSGQIVGGSTSISGSEILTRAALWQDGRIAPLEALRGSIYSLAYAINDRGEIVGVDITGSPDDPRIHAVLWRGGTVTDLGTLPGDPDSVAVAINARGDVAGSSMSGSGRGADYSPVLWRMGRITALASFPDSASGASPAAMNNRGQLVGTADVSGSPHAALWQLGTIADLGTLPGDTESFAHDINDCGQIVGQSFLDPDRRHALLWIGSNVVRLEWLPGDVTGYAGAINNSGQIVGFSGDHAVVWQIEASEPRGQSRFSRPSVCPGFRP